MGTLKIYTDENVDIRVADGLKKRGVSVVSALEAGKVGAFDEEHFRYASKIKAAIFTHDHHFIEAAKALTQEGKNHWGVIFVGMNLLSVGEYIKRLALLADILSAEEMINQIEFL